LLDLITDIELWHSLDRDPYATVPVSGHFETGQFARRASGSGLRGNIFSVQVSPG